MTGSGCGYAAQVVAESLADLIRPGDRNDIR